MRTKLVAAVGVIAGAMLLWLAAHARVPAGEGDSQTSYYLLIAGLGVWAITAMAASLSHDPTRARQRATVAGVVGVGLTAVVLGLAVHVAKTPGVTRRSSRRPPPRPHRSHTTRRARRGRR